MLKLNDELESSANAAVTVPRMTAVAIAIFFMMVSPRFRVWVRSRILVLRLHRRRLRRPTDAAEIRARSINRKSRDVARDHEIREALVIAACETFPPGNVDVAPGSRVYCVCCGDEN